MKALLAAMALSLSVSSAQAAEQIYGYVTNVLPNANGVMVRFSEDLTGVESCTGLDPNWASLPIDATNYGEIADSIKYAFRNNAEVRLTLAGCDDIWGGVPEIRGVLEKQAPVQRVKIKGSVRIKSPRIPD